MPDPQSFQNPLSQEAIDELLRESRKADREDRTRVELFERLIAGDAWKSYISLLMARLQIFSEVVLQPSGSQDGAWSREYLKGAMFGLLLARDLPSVTIDAMKRQLGPDAAEESGQ